MARGGLGEKSSPSGGGFPRFIGILAVCGALLLFFRLTEKTPSLRVHVAALLTAISIHEGGHLLAMRLYGATSREAAGEGRARSLKRAKLSPFGIELRTGRAYRSYREQVFISLAGVSVNFLTALLLRWPLGGLPQGEGAFGVYFSCLASCSLLLGCLHLLPVEGLDGGSALEGILLGLTNLSPQRVERLLFLLSVLLLIPLWLLSLCVLIASGGNPSFFALCVSLFLELYRKQSA